MARQSVVRSTRALCAAVLLAGCGSGTPDSEPATRVNETAMRDSLVAGLREYAAAAQAFDSARVMAMLATDSSMRFVEGQTFYTRDGFARLVSEAFGSLSAFEARFHFDSLALIPLTPESAVTIVPYTDVFTDRAGARTIVRGVVTWVWAVRDGRWRLVAGHAAPLPPESGQ